MQDSRLPHLYSRYKKRLRCPEACHRSHIQHEPVRIGTVGGLPEQSFRLVREQAAEHRASGNEYVLCRHIQRCECDNAV